MPIPEDPKPTVEIEWAVSMNWISANAAMSAGNVLATSVQIPGPKYKR